MFQEQLMTRLQRAIDYIESHLLDEIIIEEVAKAAYVSQAAMYTLFSNVLGTSIKEYIRKRRLSSSAYDLMHSEAGILEVAMKYQYNTYESYSRAFKKLFGLSPDYFRKNQIYVHVFPRIELVYENKTGGTQMIGKEMNKEVVMQTLKHVESGYLLDIDIDKFDVVNKTYGFEIGDGVLVEVPKRIKSVLMAHKENVDVVRINNDEFAVVFKATARDYVELLSNEMIDAMRRPFIFENLQFLVTISIGITPFMVNNSDETILKNANDAMLQAKKNGKNQIYMLES